ncbi:hypothetical protein [Amycolatopsis sp. BJA-103]|uniref:hypothetical protein n=1 Tax=unclassified Amycolatopsis TaxID=2618356 RepID=UPI000C777C49|nr:hypothetical protein [Amycolatopsis sp. BJA-103]AUI57251.1 hypothetical protein BKN51_02850 [Amycolatopsis sp. BJA-103]PNE15530.1 hypothetical protein B1H26_31235 [Amycolatopsis sp. BJA-103]
MADKPDSGDIKITPGFLKDFQDKVLQKMVDDLVKDPNVAELAQTLTSAAGKRRLLAGSEAWEPARLLIEKYEASPAGTAPSLYNQVEAIRKQLITLNENISYVVDIAEKGEDENLKLSTELNMSQLGEIFTTTPAPPPAGS